MATILIVDDEPDIVEGLSTTLKAHGYTVITAADGEDALAKAKTRSPDAIIADLVLPKLDGWRVCQILKGDLQHRHIPVILLSGLIRDETDRDELSQGDAFLPKPCTPEQVLTCVRDVLRQGRAAPA